MMDSKIANKLKILKLNMTQMLKFGRERVVKILGIGIFPFSCNFLKRFFLQIHKNMGVSGKGLMICRFKLVLESMES